MLLDINLIDIGDRLREDPGDDFKELVESVKRFGQLQPIVVQNNGNGSYSLIAGERRFRAIVLLNGRGDTIHGLPIGQIKVEVESDLSDETKLMMEFEENHRRKDFTWEERAKYVKKFHDAFVKRALETDEEWTGEMTAFALKLSPASISHYLDLNIMIEAHPEIAKAKTLRGAIKRTKQVKEHVIRMTEAAKSNTEGQQKAKECFINGDGVEWLKSTPAASVDLVNLDPPWGDESSYKTKRASWEEFDDSLEYATEIIPLLLAESYRVLKENRFCIFWYRQWAYKEMAEMAKAAGFSLKHAMTPCIWYKPDKVSDQMAYPEKQLITCYETFFILRKGDPVFYEKEVQNVFVEPRVPLVELVHQTEKPSSLMERLIRLTTTPGEVVIDPCAGSASTLVAAYRAYRKTAGCELGKKNYERSFLRLSEVMK